MAAKRVEITVPEDLLERVDGARGHEPRASFIKRALESALEFEQRLPKPPKVLVEAGADGELVISATDVLRNEWIEPEPSSGCPECGGEWAPAISPEGTYRICSDCGARESS